MKEALQRGSGAAARLLDPRFEYTPAAATNIAATWRRFGFDPQANEQRRKLVLDSFAAPVGDPLARAARAFIVCSD